MDTKIVIENAEIFNGKDPETVKGNILIENNLIDKISAQPLPPETTAGATVIDGAGKIPLCRALSTRTGMPIYAATRWPTCWPENLPTPTS